ncbi:GNAT family N-acetyltransferase [Pseudothauera lacus]|uniref:GNAT family N-acetyltransferase n=1 Tax=Pseudothauera lacus TaxID=2136175 RepID=A0A2T4IJI2_9RHOO|nr:GNAT family N-acetyltransferase [Pseudothauera lacus]PTD97933.1 GNAT family N-acetyltransferase [Pseudothauera lacus]
MSAEAASAIVVRVVDWAQAAALAMPLRERVFVVEQGVPAELEADEWDACSRHALACTAGAEVVGTGRLLPDGHIGRMAVAAAWRGRGIGARVLNTLVDAARAAGMSEVVLNAQLQAVDFYRRQGFTAYGEIFMDAGIEHVAMRRVLSARG